MKTPDFAFVIVNYNGLSDTIECIESISRCGKNTQVIVVDNASDSFDEDSVIKLHPRVEIIKNNENRGWSGGNNCGIKRAMEIGCKWICLLNNDTVISDDFLNAHELTIEANRKLRIYGPLINEFHTRDQQQTAACFFNRKTFSGFMNGKKIEPEENGSPIYPTDIVNGCCVIIHRELFEKIGYIDERYFLLCEESDFCLRARAAGFAPKILARPLVWHKHSVTFQKAGKPLQRYYGTRNLWLLLSEYQRVCDEERGRLMSTFFFLRHAYHLFCHEKDLNNDRGAFAVCDGLSDAILKKYGPMTESARLFSPIFKCSFEFTRQVMENIRKPLKTFQ